MKKHTIEEGSNVEDGDLSRRATDADKRFTDTTKEPGSPRTNILGRYTVTSNLRPEARSSHYKSIDPKDTDRLKLYNAKAVPLKSILSGPLVIEHAKSTV